MTDKVKLNLRGLDDETVQDLKETAAESDALHIEGGDDVEKSAAGDEKIEKAVERTKDRKPDDPGRDRITALAKARDKHPAEVAAELGVDPDPYRDRDDLAKAYEQNPLKNRAEPLEEAKAEAYDVRDDDSDGEDGKKAVLRHDGTVDTYARGVIEETEAGRRLVTGDGEIPLDDKAAVEKGGQRDVGIPWNSDELEKAARRGDERVLLVERGYWGN